MKNNLYLNKHAIANYYHFYFNEKLNSINLKENQFYVEYRLIYKVVFIYVIHKINQFNINFILCSNNL